MGLSAFGQFMEDLKDDPSQVPIAQGFEGVPEGLLRIFRQDLPDGTSIFLRAPQGSNPFNNPVLPNFDPGRPVIGVDTRQGGPTTELNIPEGSLIFDGQNLSTTRSNRNTTVNLPEGTINRNRNTNIPLNPATQGAPSGGGGGRFQQLAESLAGPAGPSGRRDIADFLSFTSLDRPTPQAPVLPNFPIPNLPGPGFNPFQPQNPNIAPQIPQTPIVPQVPDTPTTPINPFIPNIPQLPDISPAGVLPQLPLIPDLRNILPGIF
jgi:hypothetical protein